MPVAAVDPRLIYNIAVVDYIDLLCAINYNSLQIRIVWRRNYICDPSRRSYVADLNYPSFAIAVNGSFIRCRHFKERRKNRDGFVLNCLVVLNTKNLPLVGEVGFGADIVQFDGRSMCSPGFSCDSSLHVTYVVAGSGRVQMVGADGKRVLETHITAGSLFIVPRFFVVSKIADPEGMSWFSIVTTPNPIFTHLARRTLVRKALSQKWRSPSVLRELQTPFSSILPTEEGKERT